MSMKTVHNMDLIVIEMIVILESGDYKGLKALSHSYETLLTQIDHKHDDFEKEILRKQIPRQIEMVMSLHNNLETISIPNLLGDRNYIDVNHLTTAVARLNNIISHLNKLHKDLCERFAPKVGVFSNSQKGDGFLWYKLIEENQEKILSQKHTAFQTNVLTDKNNYTLFLKVNESVRGRRFDTVYIDKDLDTNLIELCKNFRKSNEAVALF